MKMETEMKGKEKEKEKPSHRRRIKSVKRSRSPLRSASWRQGERKTGGEGGRGPSALLERRKKPRYFRPPGAATL